MGRLAAVLVVVFCIDPITVAFVDVLHALLLWLVVPLASAVSHSSALELTSLARGLSAAGRNPRLVHDLTEFVSWST